VTFLDVVKLAGAILVALGGGGGIVFGLSGFLGKLWADRALEDHRHKYNQLSLQMQHDLDIASRRLQIELDALGLVHSLRTKEEFSHLATLWKKISTLSFALHTMVEKGQTLIIHSETSYMDSWRTDCEEALDDMKMFFSEEMIFIPGPISKLGQRMLEGLSGLPTLYYFTVRFNNEREVIHMGHIDQFLQQFDVDRNQLEQMIRTHLRGELVGETESAFDRPPPPPRPRMNIS
jgi:hypothetical protein